MKKQIIIAVGLVAVAGGFTYRAVQDHVQTDPTFQTTRLYCRLTAAEVRRQLIARKGYSHDELPSIETVTNKLNGLGFRLRKVAKCRPQKKSSRPMPSLSN
jgi:uncharacterized protein YcfJ